MDCSPPGSSIHGILQARILEWVALSFSRGSSQPRGRTQVFCIASRCFNLWATREAHLIHPKNPQSFSCLISSSFYKISFGALGWQNQRTCNSVIWIESSAFPICHGKTWLVYWETRIPRCFFHLWNVWRVCLLFPSFIPLSTRVWNSQFEWHLIHFFIPSAKFPGLPHHHGGQEVNWTNEWWWCHLICALIKLLFYRSHCFQSISIFCFSLTGHLHLPCTNHGLSYYRDFAHAMKSCRMPFPSNLQEISLDSL